MLSNPQFQEGVQAANDGKDITSNPYPEGHPHFQFFIDGFVHAKNAVGEVVEEAVKLIDEAEAEVKAIVEDVKQEV